MKNELIFLRHVAEIPAEIEKLCAGRKCIAVTDENVAKLYPSLLPQNAVVLPAGEAHKTLQTAENICRALKAASADRRSVVAAYGGGVVGDIAGFASSMYMRGIDCIHIPTTLLAQVDSAIGGKTGVDLDGYKNMLGAFHMPLAIVICPEVLSTLPAREWQCGLGELVKTALLDKAVYEFVCKHIAALVAREGEAVAEAAAMAAKFKKQITDEDPTEQGRRAILNLGHTVGHALETGDRYRLSHGAYVLLGLAVEAEMTACATEDFAADMRWLLSRAGLPALPRLSAHTVTDIATADKKNGDGLITVLGVVSAGDVRTYRYTASEFAARYTAAVKALTAKGVLRYAE